MSKLPVQQNQVSDCATDYCVVFNVFALTDSVD